MHLQLVNRRGTYTAKLKSMGTRAKGYPRKIEEEEEFTAKEINIGSKKIQHYRDLKKWMYDTGIAEEIGFRG